MNATNRAIFTSYALSQMPKEACALLIAVDGNERLILCRNISPHENAFEIHPDDYVRAENTGKIIKIIHSHVYIPATPSEVDQVACEASFVPWEILSVPTLQWASCEPNGFRAPHIGRQWAHGVLDCYSLIRDVYKDELKIEIPDFEREFEWWLNGKNLYLDNFEKAGFVSIATDHLLKYDIILMQIMSPVANHGAIYLGDDLILHHLYRRLSTRDVYGGYYKKHTVRCLRHMELV